MGGETSVARTALSLICKADDQKCSMLKAALSAVAEPININFTSYELYEEEDTEDPEDDWVHETALYAAVKNRNFLMVKLLLIHGADPKKLSYSVNCCDDYVRDNIWDYRGNQTAFDML